MVDKIEEDDDPKRSKIGWWLKWIKAAKSASKDHWKSSAEAWCEYEFSKVKDYEATHGYPAYKTSIDKLAGALFGKVPEPRSKRAFGIDDEIALTMGLVNDRLAEHLIENGECRDVWVASVQDFIHSAKASVQVLFSGDTESYRIPLTAVEKDYLTEEGEVYEGEVESEGEGEAINYFGYAERLKEGTKKIKLATLPFDEVLHTPEAKSNAEITEKAYKFCLPFDEAEELFNPDGKRSLPYTTAKYYDEHEVGETDADKNKSPGRILEGWECYCKHTRTKYWVCEKFTEDFLLTEPDTDDLRGFFPSTEFIVVNKRRKSLYPTPNWVYLESTAKQITKMYGRIFDLVDSIEPKAVVYGASKELIDALNSPGLRYVTAGKMMDILEKGGVQNLIQFIPVKELVDALARTMDLEQHFKDEFAEFFHLPDILRGQADPDQSATQSEILQDEAHDTFRVVKDLIFKMIRDSVDLMLDLAYKKLTDQEIADIIGYDYLPSGTPPTPPTPENPQGEPGTLGHKERFPEALARLRSDAQRLIRIDFETDSTSFRDDKRDIERAKLVSDTAIQGMQMISQIADPSLMPIAMNVFLGVLESIGGSSKTEDMIRKAVSDLKKAKASQPAKPPDTEMMKVELKGQELQLKAQSEQMRNANEQQKIQVENAKTEIKALEIAGKQKIAEFEMAFNAQLEKALVQLEEQRVEIERYKAELQAQESLLEEIRLRQESDAALLSQAITAAQTQAPNAVTPPQPQIIALPSAEPPNIHLNVQMPEPGKRKARITRPDGTVTEVDIGGIEPVAAQTFGNEVL